MQYLVEMHMTAEGWAAGSPGGGRVEEFLGPALEICDRLERERRIVAGGLVSGGAGLAFIVRAESRGEVDGILATLPLPAGMTTTVTRLTTWSDRPGAPGPRPPRLFMAMVPGHVLVK